MVRALTERYIEPQHEQQEEITMVGCDLKEKKVEFVGLQKALDRCADIKTINNVTLQEENVSRIGDLSSLWGEDESSIEILRLDQNLLWQWKDIEYLGKQAPKLRQLMVSFNYLGVPKCISTGLFQNLEVLALTKSIVPADNAPFRNDIFKVLASAFPNLNELAVGNNSWASIPDAVDKDQWIKLQKLDMDKNEFRSWDQLEKLHSLTRLVHLQIAGCGLGDLNQDIMQFPQLKSIVISDNGIAEWETFYWLCMAFPCLQAIRVQNNPFLGKDGEFASIARPLITALWPDMQFINGGEVRREDRLHAERYFLVLWKRDYEPVLKVDPDKRIYDRLVEKHGEPMDSAQGGAANNGSIASSLVHFFVCIVSIFLI